MECVFNTFSQYSSFRRSFMICKACNLQECSIRPPSFPTPVQLTLFHSTVSNLWPVAHKRYSKPLKIFVDVQQNFYFHMSTVYPQKSPFSLSSFWWLPCIFFSSLNSRKIKWELNISQNLFLRSARGVGVAHTNYALSSGHEDCINLFFQLWTCSSKIFQSLCPSTQQYWQGYFLQFFSCLTWPWNTKWNIFLLH